MKQNKGLKYYLKIFGIAVVALLIYTIVDYYKNDALNVDMLVIAVLVPLVFTAFLFVFDKIFDFIFNKISKRKPKKDTGYDAFLSMINKIVEEQTNFTIEEYRHLRINERFQKSLKQIYTIYETGETEDLSYDYLHKKFKKNTNEFIALNIVIEEVKKLEENS